MPFKEFDVDGIGPIKVYKRRGNRSLRLTVAADGKVSVSIPVWAPYQAGVTFTMSKRSWILAQARQEAELLRPGQAIGKLHRLQFIADPTAKSVRTSVRSSAVAVIHPSGKLPSDSDVQAAAQAASWRALKTQSVKLLTPRLNQLAAQHGFSYRSLNIKRMKTRWGSCDQHTNIIFNLFLVQLPWELIDYVIIHELVHTRVLHHGPDFWEEFESVLPGARRLRNQMRAYRPTIVSSI